ncbi:MAG: phospholipid/cholesterol/gamma-HCH transport system substrate-binding protein, partial [Actinomycetota bacterium]|nr:phospholipid/cholesterol/gamma-HCH transport system substrate-binding protein [Actinomycetota bacterium]
MRARIVSVVLVVVLAAAAFGAYETLRPKDDTYTVTAEIAQAPNLFSGGRVMVRGVEVGKVTRVTPSPTGVTLTMAIQDGIKVPAQAHLSVV